VGASAHTSRVGGRAARPARGLAEPGLKHPDTAEPVPVTREEVLQHAEAEHRVAPAPIRVLWPYGDD